MMIWYEKTFKREYNEKLGEIQAQWAQTANILAAQYDTAIGNKKRHKAKDFMPDFETKKKNSKQKLIEQAEKIGLKTPSKQEI